MAPTLAEGLGSQIGLVGYTKPRIHLHVAFKANCVRYLDVGNGTVVELAIVPLANAALDRIDAWRHVHLQLDMSSERANSGKTQAEVGALYSENELARLRRPHRDVVRIEPTVRALIGFTRQE